MWLQFTYKKTHETIKLIKDAQGVRKIYIWWNDRILSWHFIKIPILLTDVNRRPVEKERNSGGGEGRRVVFEKISGYGRLRKCLNRNYVKRP